MTEEINGLIYERDYHIIINEMPDSIYYYFDYDQRSYQVNMDFQHFHSFHEIHILLSPKATHWIEGIPYAIHVNDFVLLRPSLLHKTDYLEGAPSKRIIINFLFPADYINSHPGISMLLEPFKNQVPIFRFDQQKQAVLNHLLNDIVSLSKQPLKSQMQVLLLHNRFTDFLYKLWEIKDHNLYAQEKSGNDLSEKIYQITSYIHSHYQEELSLDYLAGRFYISTYYLSHQFHKVTGYTLVQYIQLTRIRNSQYSLLNSDKKITEIAELCGFTSFSQFNRVFRKFSGKSPSEFRKSPTALPSPPHISSE